MSQVPIDTSYFASDLVAMVDDLPAIAYYGGTSFNVSVTQLSSEQSLIMVGNNDKAVIQAIFPVSYCSTVGAPTVQGRMAIKMPSASTTANYEIVRRELMEDGIAYRLTLMADNRLT